MRANGSRECAPDDRLREAIQFWRRPRLDRFVASAAREDGRRNREHRPFQGAAKDVDGRVKPGHDEQTGFADKPSIGQWYASYSAALI